MQYSICKKKDLQNNASAKLRLRWLVLQVMNATLFGTESAIIDSYISIKQNIDNFKKTS